MSEDVLEPAIAAALAARAGALGLDAARLKIRYVLNWGGFVNRSYHVTDGTRRLHLKLAGEPEYMDGLRAWRGVADVLTARYHAPRMVGWLHIPGMSLEGPLFEQIEGATAEARTPGLLAAVAPLLARLHGDAELAARLAADHPPRRCRDTFTGTFIRRFREDLEHVRSDPPPFVSGTLLDWMERETDAMEREAATRPEFAEPADAPVHADLWLGNLLEGAHGRVWLLDWDDLMLGDPALDWATLLGPTRADVSLSGHATLPPQALAPGVAERLPLYARATLLDWVLDPLADWIEAATAPEHASEVRAEKERIHRAALAVYRATY
ncbi:MAG TPA: phosphotransferase [Longimicrobium sp.]|nr:phosphotransferase [Longimicrobium sp.]